VGTPKIGFVGGMHFRPNQLSAEWILDSVAPELEQRKFAGELLIAGKNPSNALVAKAKRFPFVQVLGFVPDLSSFWSDVSYSLSPHLEGSGVRTKLWESLASGIPVLTHVAALEQVSDELKGHPLLKTADSPDEWARILCEAPAEATTGESWERLLKSPPAWFGA
jgi:glycosyltransferase involved in cell wall biosynthesis